MGYVGWVIVGVVVSMCGGALVWFEKPLLRYFHPLQLNFVVRLVTFAILAAAVLPLTVFNACSLVISTPPGAVGYIALAALFEWVIALSAFYYALRISKISVVTPIVAAAPLFTALFAAIFFGERLGPLVITGVLVTVTGVAVLSRWMPADEEVATPQVGDALVAAVETTDAAAIDAGAAVADPPPVDAEPVPTAADPPPAGADPEPTGADPAPARRSRHTLLVVGPALVAAIAWGAYPIFVEAAERVAGGPTAGMMLESQILGAVLLIPFLAARRRRRRGGGWRPTGVSLRVIVLLLVGLGLLELTWGVLFYFLVEELGPVLTGILTGIAPVFSVLGGVLIWKERLNALAWVGAFAALAGVFIASLGSAA